MAEKRREKLTKKEIAGAAVLGGATVGTAVAGFRIAQRGENAANRAARGRIDRIVAERNSRVAAITNDANRRINGRPTGSPPAARTSKIGSAAKSAGRGAIAATKATGSAAVWAVRTASKDITGVKGVAGIATKAGRAEAAAGAKQAASTIKQTVAAVKDARAANVPFRDTARIAAGGGQQALQQAGKLLSGFGGVGKVAAIGLSLGGAGYAAYKTYQKGKEANAADNVATAGIDALTAGGSKTFRDRMAQGDSAVTAAARGFATFVDRKLTFGAGQAAKDQLQIMFAPDSGNAKGIQDASVQGQGLGAAILAGVKSGHAGQNTPLPPQPKEAGTSPGGKGDGSKSASAAPKKPEKAERVAYTKVDGTTAQLTQAQADAAKARRASGARTDGGALKAA